MQQRFVTSLGRDLRINPFQSTRRLCSPCSAKKTSVIRDLQLKLRSKERSATQVVQQYLDSISRNSALINSFITVDAEAALAQAKEIDAKIAADGYASLGALAGIPVAIKDNLCTQGVRTTAGSGILKSYIPTYDATSVAKLKAAGAIVIGKTNMDEFGMGSTTENSAYKPTCNPWNPDCVPGGSSGGSAASVAANECAVALGTDTGGSIRQPAHFCGVVGLKPTYGRVSRYGLVAYASSLDCVGPMAHCVEDVAIVLGAIAGSDPLDSTSSNNVTQDFTSELFDAAALADQPLKGKRLGLISETLGEGVQPEVEVAIRKAAKHFESLGAEVEEVSLPTFRVGLPAYYVIALSEASSNLSRYDGVRYGARSDSTELNAMYQTSRGQGLGEEVKRRILMGTYALSSGYYDAYYKKAQQVRSLVRSEMTEALSKYDALILPTAPTTAYKLGEKSEDPLSMYKGDLMTVNVNLSGLPAIVLPCEYIASDDGKFLPIGLQMIGSAFGESSLLQLAHAFEQTAPDAPDGAKTAV
eukprot:gene31197-6344_t